MKRTSWQYWEHTGSTLYTSARTDCSVDGDDIGNKLILILVLLDYHIDGYSSA